MIGVFRTSGYRTGSNLEISSTFLQEKFQGYESGNKA